MIENNGAVYTNIPADFASFMNIGVGDCVRVSYSDSSPVVVDEKAIIIRRVENE